MDLQAAVRELRPWPDEVVVGRLAGCLPAEVVGDIWDLLLPVKDELK